MVLSFTGLVACLLATALPSSARAGNLLANGDFEAGNTGFTSGYTYVSTVDQITAEGEYTVGSGGWLSFGDHTSGHGNMLVANGSPNANTSVWTETVSVIPYTEYVLSFWGASVNQSSQSLPVLQAFINSTVAGNSLTLTQQGGIWLQGSAAWFSGSSSAVTLSIVDLNTAGPWNDFVIDDVSFTATVPEPTSLALLASGVVVVASRLRRGRGLH
ncbi:PEP-CTERM sorting domain-containing protein [Aquisphaera giovannonii]|uniref:PEP-CTERM sorting domain-containing protein n=1 Tax=Aquisphaera giovannonii TaxID=406548 RepID=UPI00143DECEE|nr:PEP-CTERM sorting domain-containing protein [Aquisphaera giovannonii]